MRGINRYIGIAGGGAALGIAALAYVDPGLSVGCAVVWLLCACKAVLGPEDFDYNDSNKEERRCCVK